MALIFIATFISFFPAIHGNFLWDDEGQAEQAQQIDAWLSSLRSKSPGS